MSASGNKEWAYRLMRREASGEQINVIAAQFWREALGYPKDADAKQVLKSLEVKEAA